LIKVAKIASVVIAIFSFIVAPLLQYAPEGLWQIIRIFTGFYNIPVIAVVMIGLFTKRVPAFAAKLAIVFHVIAYALLKFVIDIDLNFIYIYAVLFVIEVSMMLLIGQWKPTKTIWEYTSEAKVDMQTWRYAIPACATLMTGMILLYLLFSPVGLVNGIDSEFWLSSLAVVLANIGFCFWSLQRQAQKV